MYYEMGENGEKIFTGSDSTVMVRPGYDHVIKEYKCLSPEAVKQYTRLHHILSQHIFVLPFSDEDRERFGITLETIEVHFLDLGEDIYTSFGLTKHSIPLVEGDILNFIGKYLKLPDAQGFISFLEKEIAYFISAQLGILPHPKEFDNCFYIVQRNVKIASMDAKRGVLIVTDIGSSISLLLMENKAIIDRILQPQ